MNDFTYRGAWSHGLRFVARGAGIHFLILVLIGIAAPAGVQFGMAGVIVDAASSPMTAGMAMMQSLGAPVVLLAIALVHVLQSGSYLAALRFGFAGGRGAGAAGGAIGFGLVAGVIATLIVAAGYLVAILGAQGIAGPQTVEAAVFVLLFPLVLVYSMVFISQAILAAATIIATLLFLFVYGAIQGYPELAAVAFGGSGTVTVIMLVLSGLLFWLAARFSCVTAVMARRGSLNVFAAIGESWRMTSDEQGAITGYLALVGFAIGLTVIGVSLLVGFGLGGMMNGGGIGMSGTGELVLRLLFAVPLAFLSVILPAGIHRELAGDEEETDAAIFE